MKRIGLFGGSFDPVHRAHVALARSALEQLALDEVRWIPAGDPWQKPRSLTPGAQREAMLAEVIEGEPRFTLDRRELLRSGPSYTLDTVREVQQEEPHAECFLILGEDQYEGLHTWHGWRELLERVTLAIARRPGPRREPDAAVRAAAQRIVALPMMEVSATEIRDRIAAGLPIDDLVPETVAGYIDRHGLYRATARS